MSSRILEELRLTDEKIIKALNRYASKEEQIPRLGTTDKKRLKWVLDAQLDKLAPTLEAARKEGRQEVITWLIAAGYITLADDILDALNWQPPAEPEDDGMLTDEQLRFRVCEEILAYGSSKREGPDLTLTLDRIITAFNFSRAKSRPIDEAEGARKEQERVIHIISVWLKTDWPKVAAIFDKDIPQALKSG